MRTIVTTWASKIDIVVGVTKFMMIIAGVIKSISYLLTITIIKEVRVIVIKLPVSGFRLTGLWGIPQVLA